MYNMYSPTLLGTCRNQLVSCPWLADHNFFILANPDLIVHRYEEGLKSWQIMYSSYEVTDNYLDQYGTNEYKDFSNLTISVDDFPPTVTEPDLALEPYPQSEPDLVSPSYDLVPLCLFCTMFCSSISLHLTYVLLVSQIPWVLRTS